MIITSHPLSATHCLSLSSLLLAVYLFDFDKQIVAKIMSLGVGAYYFSDSLFQWLDISVTRHFSDSSFHWLIISLTHCTSGFLLQCTRSTESQKREEKKTKQDQSNYQGKNCYSTSTIVSGLNSLHALSVRLGIEIVIEVT